MKLKTNLHKALRLYLRGPVPGHKKRGSIDRRVSVMFCYIEYTKHTPLFASTPPRTVAARLHPPRDTKPSWLYQAPRYTVTSIIP
jgi:hypothetical protein